jgi:hypothetical protein
MEQMKILYHYLTEGEQRDCVRLYEEVKRGSKGNPDGLSYIDALIIESHLEILAERSNTRAKSIKNHNRC